MKSRRCVGLNNASVSASMPKISCHTKSAPPPIPNRARPIAVSRPPANRVDCCCLRRVSSNVHSTAAATPE